MSISSKMKININKSAWIFEMFQKMGDKNIFDFTLGNPEIETPSKFTEELKNIMNSSFPGMHRYSPLAGYDATREAIAKTISKEREMQLDSRHVILTAGCAGALNIALKTLIDHGDEAIILVPSYTEYPYYIDNNGGICQRVETNPDFTINFDNLVSKINSKTKAIILNSPNNPTGEIYSEKDLKSVSKILHEKSQEFEKDIFLIFDEAYRDIVFDNNNIPDIFKIYPNTIITYGYSKPLSIPGERIGYAAINPVATDIDELIKGMTYANRFLYINAPSLMQRVIANIQGVKVDIKEYQERRDLFCDSLDELGYAFIRPKGTYYIFPKTPIDDIKFTKELMNEKIYVLPGTIFDRSGYFRIAFCVQMEKIQKSLEGFKKVIRKYN